MISSYCEARRLAGFIYRKLGFLLDFVLGEAICDSPKFRIRDCNYIVIDIYVNKGSSKCWPVNIFCFIELNYN